MTLSTVRRTATPRHRRVPANPALVPPRKGFYRHGSTKHAHQLPLDHRTPTLWVRDVERLTCDVHGGRLRLVRIGGVEVPYCYRCVERPALRRRG